MKDKRLYLQCECGCEVMSIEQDEEIDSFYYVSIYKLYDRNKLNWKDRFGHIWRIIIYGSPYEDQMVLTKDELNKINDIL